MILADLSRYDPDSSAADYEGVILNVEDPGVENKAAIAHAAGRAVLLYSWVYPGGGAAAVARGRDLALRLGYVLGVWLDYEQAGCVPQDIRDAHATDTGGVRFGVYAYLAMLREQGVDLLAAISPWPLWIAYYPGNNDGSYPGSQVGEANAYGAVLWQFTSTSGTRDLNMVLSDAWWQEWNGSLPPEEDDVKPLYISKKTAPGYGIFVTDGIHKRHIIPEEWAFISYTSGGPPPVVAISDAWWDSIPTAAVDTARMVAGALVPDPAFYGTFKNLGNVTGGGGGAGPLNVTLSGRAVPV